MRIASLLTSAVAVCLISTGIYTASTVHAAQQPQAGPHPGGPMQQRNFPKPTNLMVLPDNLTGAQVRDIMRKWEGDLGAECDTCHSEYADHRKSERGQPQLDFASDAKPEKKMARLMYTMTEDLKSGAIQKVKDLDEDAKDMNHPKPAELTCGTCHRGKLDPEAYVPPKEDRGPGGGMPGMQGMPPMQGPPKDN